MAAKKTTKKPRIKRPNLLGKVPDEKPAPAKKATPAKQSAKKPRGKTSHTPRTLIEKAFKGTKHSVQVTANGYTYKGAEFTSLTAIAKKISGYPSVSGPRFFGTDGKGGAK